MSGRGRKTKKTKRAVPFIRLVDEAQGTYEVCEEAKEILKDVVEPFGVVSIVGKYRTGKSFFLNKCLLDSSAFPVGNTIQACTKGLWLFEDPLKGPIPIFVIDTEGIGALDANNTHDTRIFAMAMLMSSFFIYNSLNVIDEEALNQLSLVTNICKHVRITADKEATPEELGKEVFPPLLWMVRDFSLQLKDEFGRDIGANEYLEQALKDTSKNTSTENQSKSNLRKCLRDCFQTRSCATLIRPCNNEADLQSMNSSKMDSPIYFKYCKTKELPKCPHEWESSHCICRIHRIRN